MAIHPVQAVRLFTFDTYYDKIPWNEFPAVATAFRQNLEYWYLLPALQVKENHHFGFSVLANTCMLIDSLSQYEAGAVLSGRTIFKNYLRKHWPTFDTPFATAIQSGADSLTDIADVIYGVRCGVLHENHIPLYAGLIAQADIAICNPTGYATYSDGADCPVVTIDPGRFFDAVNTRFEAYFADLVNPTARFDPLRAAFKAKFEAGFGVTISTVV
jgi:hypothetical protein